MKVAALDLGSNSFLCLICEVSQKNTNSIAAPVIGQIYSDQVKIVRLGQGVGQTKKFHPDALIRAEQCLVEFKKTIDQHQPDKILAMATSAARDALNQSELLDIGKRLGIPIAIIPGHDEARITYSGAISGMKNPNKRILLIDIGGGSTEFIVGENQKTLFSKSLDMGVVRFTEKLITQQPISESEIKSCEQSVRSEIQKIKQQLIELLPQEVVAVAGTPTTLAAAEIGRFDPQVIDGYIFTSSQLKSWEEKLSNSTVQEKISRYHIDAGRADVIYLGALILRVALEELKISQLTVSTRGVRFGVALDMAK